MMRNYVLKSSNGLKWHLFNAAEGTDMTPVAYCGRRAVPDMKLWPALAEGELPKKRRWCDECAAKAPEDIKNRLAD
jgi:hypothetical protein